MAKLKPEDTPKLFVKAVKKKFAETSGSPSSVHESETLGNLSSDITFENGVTMKGKKTTPPSNTKIDRCALCNGKLKESTTEFMARASGEVVIIKDVPAFVCEECGESYFSGEISRKIDVIMREAYRKKLCVRPVPAGEVSLNT